MNTYTRQSTSILGDATRLNTAIERFSAEVKAFAAAIFAPNRLIGEVQQMIALQRQARQLEATDPARAAALMTQASRIGR